MTKVAITGGTGFVGRYVINRLNNVSAEITAITRSMGSDLPHVDSGRWLQLDIENPPDDAFTYLGKPDLMIHLAWQGLPNYKSLHHYETELQIQYNFLSNVLRNGLPSLVVAGTCFEYGMQSGCLSEAMEAKPSNPMGYAKNGLRRQLTFLQEDLEFNLTWARLFYMYGEGQAETSIYSQLSTAAQEGSGKFNMSKGEQLRDFLRVEDVAQYLVDLAEIRKNVGVVNICSGEPISIRNLVERWMEERGWKLELNLGYYPYPDYEPMAFWGDKTYLLQLLKNT